MPPKGMTFEDGYKTRQPTPKQMVFTKLYIEYSNATQAYAEAYDSDNMKYETLRRKAYEVLHSKAVQKYLEKLQEKSAIGHNITIDTLTKMYLEDRVLAHDTETPSAAISAVTGLAKLHGLLVDKSVVEITDMASQIEERNANAEQTKTKV